MGCVSPSSRTSNVKGRSSSVNSASISEAYGNSARNGTGHTSPMYARTAALFMRDAAADREIPSMITSKKQSGTPSASTASTLTQSVSTASKDRPAVSPLRSRCPSHTTRTSGECLPARVRNVTDSPKASPTSRPIPRNPRQRWPRFPLCAIGTSALSASHKFKPGPLSLILSRRASTSNAISTRPDRRVPAPSTASAAF